MAICPGCGQEHWKIHSKTERSGDAYVTTFWTIPPCKPIIVTETAKLLEALSKDSPLKASQDDTK